MEKWQAILRDSVTSPTLLSKYFNVDITSLDKVIATFPMRINPYYLKLIQKTGVPLWKQAVPDVAELLDPVCMEDPLGEERLSPVPNLVHKYPDRVLFLVFLT